MCYTSQERFVRVLLLAGGQHMQYQPGNFSRWVLEGKGYLEPEGVTPRASHHGLTAARI